MSQRIHRLIEMALALSFNRRLTLFKGARLFGRVRKSAESRVTLGPHARVDGLDVHGRGTLRLGARVEVKNLSIDFGLSDGMVDIADDVYMADGAKLIVFGRLSIGPGSIFGPDVVVVDTVHRHGVGVLLRTSGVDVRDVSIGSNCWIGARVSIMPGVRVHDDVVVGAGSVVTRDCSRHHVYAGVPAKMIKPYES
ncbi:acyltransferase [Aquabacterium soli]|uniref:Acyltransferase n=1 Tax=Aquabacterium soli TaxID=2493092 RepID=A0A426VBY0_9BURK|nr:acyltransferase [Aquabacterium soli]RRS04341.1 acyltransferase [Aquabacterium soli]